MEKGNPKNATVTDIDGNFTITSEKPIVITYVGMKPKTVDVKGKSTINIQMEDDNTTLEDVVVIGYGTMKRKSLTGAVASVTGEKSASWRLTGKVNTSSKDEITDQVTSRGNSANVTYKLGGTDFSGKIDFLYKVDGFIFGSGLGFKDGIYHHFTLGTNLRNFEFGAFFGFYHQYDKIEYEASRCEYEYHLFSPTDETCSSSFYESVYRFNTAPFIGAYAGLIIDKFFINYSVSVYSPSVNIEENAPTLAAIATQYLTAGIRINKWIELSAGSTMTYMDTPHWHYGFTGGISFYAM